MTGTIPNWRNSVPFLIAALLLALAILIAILLFVLQRQRRLVRPPPAQTIYQIPAATTEEMAEKDRTIASLTQSLEKAHQENGEALERMTRQAGIEITTRVEAARLRLLAEFHERKREDRKASNVRSRGALLAKVVEHIGPLVPGFPYNLKEARHVGEIFDYLIFDGLEAGGDMTVIFLEVKTTTTGRVRRVTNPREKALRAAIKAGRVEYRVWQPPTDDQLSEKLERMLGEQEREAIEGPLDKAPGGG